MTRSQRFIVDTVRTEINEGIDAQAALIRAANKLGITQAHTLRAWNARKG